MKNTIPLLLLGSLFLFACGPTQVIVQPTPEAAPPPQLSYQSFYDELAPYGSWIDYPGYGYVWRPDAGPDFKPYSTNGDWVYTDAGWAWASDYSWGWAPFHYGRWFYEGGYGWMWIPGNEWAPAWVSWRKNDDYYGWAPLGPNVSVNIALSSYSPPVNYWNFVPRTYMGRPEAKNYYVNESRNVTIVNNTTIINNNTTIINNTGGSNRTRIAYAPGPDPGEVTRVTGSPLRPLPVRESNAPAGRVSNGQYNIYRPQVSAVPSNTANSSVRPARVQAFRDVHPVTQNQPERTYQNSGTNPPGNGAGNNFNHNGVNTPGNQANSNLNNGGNTPPLNGAGNNFHNNGANPPAKPVYNHPPVNPAPTQQPAPVNNALPNNNRQNDPRFTPHNNPPNNNPPQNAQVPQPSPPNRAALNVRAASQPPRQVTQPAHPAPNPAQTNKPSNAANHPKDDKSKEHKQE
jgi:hypothetical protein